MEPSPTPSTLFIPASEIETRLSRLQEMMTEEGIDGVLLFQNVDRLYFSGTMQPGCFYIPAEGEPIVLARRNIDRTMEESPLSNVVSLPSTKEIPTLLAKKDIPFPQILGLELDVLPVNQFLQLRKIFKKTRLLDVSVFIRLCRMIKSAWEIENTTRASQMLYQMILEVPRIIQPGMTELELAGQLEAFLRREGHQGYIRSRAFNQEMFYGHLLSGPEGVEPSYLDSPSGGTGIGPAFSQGAGRKTIKPHEPISIDLVGCYNGYLADQTRMFSLGEPSPAVKNAYQAVKMIQDTLVTKTQPGTPGNQVYYWALEEADRLGFLTLFMGKEKSSAPYIGHGLGLELDELPVIGQKFERPLEPGMVFALEPKIVLPDDGLVGIENTFLMTEQGIVSLTTAPEDFHVL